jgi:hypothetical protein
MTIEVTEVCIHPFTIGEDGGAFNTYAEGLTDAEIDGWNVHAFGEKDGDPDDFDEQDFDDFETAWAYAETLAEKYDVEIDERW